MRPNKNMMRIYIAISIIFVVFCVIAFAVPFHRTAVFWISFVAGLVAVGIQVFVMKTAFDKGEGVKSKFYGWPIARVGVTYMAAQMVLSIVFMALAEHAKNWVVIVADVIILAIAAIGFIAADATRDEVERQDVKLKKDVTTMRALQSRARALVGQLDGEAGKAIEKLSDEFRFSDPVSGDALEEIEEELTQCLNTIQQAVVDGDRDAVLTLCRKASLVLAERNRLCKLNK